MAAIRILIADDHPAFRRGLRAWLSDEPRFDVVAEAGTSEEVVRLAQALLPDIILMDIKMPPFGGIEATRRILSDQPDIAIIIVSMLDDAASQTMAKSVRARGYLTKDADEDDLMRAITLVAHGYAIFQEVVGESFFINLTRGDRDLLHAIAQGKTNAEIASKLQLALHSVENNVSALYRKINVANRHQAIIYGRELGFGQEEH